MVKFVDFLHLRANEMTSSIDWKSPSARLDFELFLAFLFHKLATSITLKMIPAPMQQEFVLS